MPEKPVPTPKQPEPLSQADDDFRKQCAVAALAEIVKWQVAERKGGQEDVAASWAFRYADRMLTQSKRPVRNMTVHIRGVPGVTVPEDEPIAEVQ